LKNIHIRLFFLIILLVAGSIYVIVTKAIHKGLDIQGGMRVVLQAKTDDPQFVKKGGIWNQDKLETIAKIMRHRVDFLGVAEPVVYPQGADRLVVELPGVKNPEKALEVVQSTAKLEFRYVPEFEKNTWRHEPERIGEKETGFETITGPEGRKISEDELKEKFLATEPICTGADLQPTSRAELTAKGYIIHFSFQGDARGKFEEFTRSHINKPLAIFLDNKLISAPNINDVIPGEGIIEGRFTAEQAKTLANQLNAGALPVPLEMISRTSVEATLGAAAVKQTITAGVVGLVLVLVFMLGFYLLPGVLADFALILYALFTFAVFKMVPVTLTVPGIAGFILSIGMAVDANILIFERMKEERKSGKSLRSSIEVGFKRAFTAIFDSNMCTLITCGILYQFGTGQVRGFALTLAIGVVVSMFTAITCTRTFLLLISGAGFAQNDSLYGLNRGFHPKLGVTKRMRFWFGLSGAIIVPGIIFLALGGLKQSIEFTGGTEITARFASAPNVGELESTLNGLGFKEHRILLAEGNRAFITLKGTGKQAALTQQDEQKVTDALKAKPGTTIEGVSVVSGIISRELIVNAILSVVYASGLIILYLAIRFSIPNFIEGLKFGTCAVVALLHDVLVLLGAFAIMGYLRNWQIDSLFVTAMLTVIGFSVHDTIIIFDRVRENLHHRPRGEAFAETVDRSIEQTFARSINTSGTVVLTLVCLLILGGPVIKLFVAALLIGIVSGTYSSIFNASPLLVLWKQLTGERAPAPAAAIGGAARPAPRKAEPVSQPKPLPSAPAAPVAQTAPVVRTDRSDGSDEAGAVDRIKPKKRKQRRR
jgi:SecD/SecF fusion protein